MLSSEFIWRRVHSLMGLWLVLYLTYHLFVNSTAALWFGEESNFVRLVNQLETLPYLHVVESLFIGLPLLAHGIWGIKRALESKFNTLPKGGIAPALNYGRNHAFTWQRITSWILLVGIIGHVVQMRFLYQPKLNEQGQYWVAVSPDRDIDTVAKKLKAAISYKNGQAIVSGSTPGIPMLFMVRDTFKSMSMKVFYSLFVLSAAFHAFNGLWTAFITWGMILSYRSQRALLPIGWMGAALLSLLGFLAIWGS